MARKRRKKKVKPLEEEPKNYLGEITDEEIERMKQESTEVPLLAKAVVTISETEKILLTAPVLPWKIDKTYIDKDFRKAYVALLTNLVSLHNLPYSVDQTGVLTPK